MISQRKQQRNKISKNDPITCVSGGTSCINTIFPLRKDLCSLTQTLPIPCALPTSCMQKENYIDLLNAFHLHTGGPRAQPGFLCSSKSLQCRSYSSQSASRRGESNEGPNEESARVFGKSKREQNILFLLRPKMKPNSSFPTTLTVLCHHHNSSCLFRV